MNYLLKSKKFSVEDLQSNEEFISVVFFATQVAIMSHQEEKFSALSNALVSAALQRSSKDEEFLGLTFIRFVEELTPLHIRVLQYLVDHRGSIVSLTSYPQLFGLIEIGVKPPPSKDEFILVINDLEAKGIIRISQGMDNFEDLYNSSAILDQSSDETLPRIVVTEIGEKFINYIAKPK